MYSFETNSGRRRRSHTIRILTMIILILAILLAGVTVSWFRTRNTGAVTREVLIARATSEAADAQAATYRLTQSSGSNTMTLLATVRSHIYCLQCIHTLTSNIYGAGTVIVDPKLLSPCIETLDQAETKLQAGNVLTAMFTTLRDQVDLVAAAFNLN